MNRYVVLGLLAACGGSGGGHHGPAAPRPFEIRLEPTVAAQTFYRSHTTCAQGPFDIELPVGDASAKYGEVVELTIRTPRAVALHAVVDDGSAELANIYGVFDASGQTSGPAANARCAADAHERLALDRAQRAGGSTGTPGAGATSSVAVTNTPPAAAVTAQLDVTGEAIVGSMPMLTIHVPTGRTSIHVRFWSIEPNDLDGVVFGLSHVVFRPNVSEAEYEAHLAAQAEAAENERRRAEKEASLRAAAAPVVVVDERAAADAERKRRERAEADARAAEKRQHDAELAAAKAQLEAERRKAFCATHPNDRGCWGPGGLRIHLDLEARAHERRAYCEAHHEDARCFTDADWQRIHDADHQRLTVALTPSKPSGPPPAPLAETVPPKLSVHAEWRPGYWHWIDSTWVWLAGQWRVPDADIVAEQTTTAPAAPPPPQGETPPAPPVQSAVWVAGFWQWDGTTWVWIAGSWQLRPAATVTWRAATWQPRGSMHVLVPGAWVRIGGSR